MKRVIPALMIVLVVLFGFTAAPLEAQNRANVWYFSNNAGLDFNQNPVAAINSIPIPVAEGSATICDPVTGELLIYTNGADVFNGAGELMENGDQITGWPCFGSAMQGAVIVPMPENPDRYYIFTSDCGEVVATRDPSGQGNGIQYSIVDVAANGGAGRVLEKRNKFTQTATEQINAVQHCNARDYWVVSRAYSRPEAITRDINVHLVSPKGVEGNKVVSQGLNPMTSLVGNLKFSHDGRWLVSAPFLADRGDWPGAFVELYRFDNRTGEISDGIVLNAGFGSTGMAFSADNSKLYVCMREDASSRAGIYQFDLASGTMEAIRDSRAIVSDGRASTSGLGLMQLAPDGRIMLVGAIESFSVGYIENPNAVAFDVQVVLPGEAESIQLAASNSTSYALPVFVNSFVGASNIAAENCPLPERSQFSVSDNNFCPGECIDFTDESSDDVTTYFWTFEGGNPATSTDASPSGICFDQPGSYVVRQCVANDNGEIFSETTIVVRGDCAEPNARFDLDRTSICIGECINISNTSIGATSYEWDFTGASNITNSTDENPPNVCYDEAGTYTIQLRARNDVGNNVATRLIEVTDCPTVVAGFTTERTQICAGECITFTNTSVGADSYQWSFSSGDPAGSTERDPGDVCFNEAGVFTITLTASNDNGDDTEVLTLTVLDGNALSVSAPDNLNSGSGAEIEIPISVTVAQPNTTIQIPSLTIRVEADARLLEFLSADLADVFVSAVNGSNTLADLTFNNLTLTSGENQLAIVRANTIHNFPEIETAISLSLQNLDAESCIAVNFTDGLYTQSEQCDGTAIELASAAFGIVNVAPNPTADEVFVEIQSSVAGTHTLEVVSVWGELVERETWENRPSRGQVYAFEAQFQVDSLPAGVYFLRLRTAGGIQSERFVVGH